MALNLQKVAHTRTYVCAVRFLSLLHIQWEHGNGGGIEKAHSKSDNALDSMRNRVFSFHFTEAVMRPRYKY